MSTELNPDTAEGALTKHNSASRAEVIRNSLKRYYQLDKEIADLTEEHLKELRQEKSAITKRLREDYNMPAKVFRAKYGMYRLEAQAVESEDNVTLDALKEMAEMAPVGTQINMVDALEMTTDNADKAKDPAEDFEEEEAAPDEEGEEGDDAGLTDEIPDPVGRA